MDECKWEEGFLHICDDRAEEVRANITLAEEYFPFCKWCGADIRIPEVEKPLIIRSGETWVAHWKDIDYLWTGENLENEYQPIAILRLKLIDKDPDWELFSEIELTDEIAKLRPMVIEGCIGMKPRIIYGIDNGMGIFVDHARYRTRLHLATPHELQESE